MNKMEYLEMNYFCEWEYNVMQPLPLPFLHDYNYNYHLERIYHEYDSSNDMEQKRFIKYINTNNKMIKEELGKFQQQEKESKK